MVYPSSYELVDPVWLKLPKIKVYANDLLKCLTVYDRLSSAGQVWKQLRKLVAVHSMSLELDAELGVRALVRSPDKFETALEETQILANRDRW